MSDLLHGRENPQRNDPPPAGPTGWGFEPNLPPPGSNAGDPRGQTPGTGLTRFDWGGMFPRPATALPATPGATLADAVTNTLNGGGGIAPHPAVVQVGAARSPWATLLVLGALLGGAVLAWRWWVKHHGGK